MFYMRESSHLNYLIVSVETQVHICPEDVLILFHAAVILGRFLWI